MAIDPQDGYPDDWIRPAPAPLDDGYPDDWFVPPSAQGAGFPDDWVGPVHDSPSTPQAAPAPQSRAAAYLRPNPSDSFAAFLPFMPATRAAMSAWGQPTMGDALGQSPLQQVWPAALPPLPTDGLLGSPTGLQSTSNAPPFTSTSLFGSATAPKSESGGVPGYSRLFGGAPMRSSNDASPYGGLLGGVALPKSKSSDASSLALPADDAYSAPPLNLQFGSAFDPSLVQQTRLETGYGDQSGSGFDGVDRSVFSNPSTDLGGSSEENSSVLGTGEPRAGKSNESSSITRLVRDSSGRPIAIIHLEPDQSGTSPSDTLSDASPDGLQPGDQYAQINRAPTGNPLIDRTTEFLLDALQQSIQAMGPGRGPLFGTRVHVDFAKRVKELDLPGIGKDGVEQTFKLSADVLKYGLEGSIRTDVALRDPKHPDQPPIMVYDLKTGNAVLTSKRIEEIRREVGRPDLPVIMLHYITGDALYPRGGDPPR
jgi:hypothetical protein